MALISRNSKNISLPGLSSTDIQDITGIRNISGEILKDKYIKDFRDLINLPSQKQYRISSKNWNMLKNGEYSNGNKWINKNEEVIGFVFCIFFNPDDHENIAYFRIRSIFQKKYLVIPTLNFKIKIPHILNFHQMYIEQNYVAYTSNKKGTIDDLNFIYDSSQIPKLNTINAYVDDFKRNWAKHLNSKPIPNIIKGNSPQQGVIFKSNTGFMNQLDTLGKTEFTVDFGWDETSHSFNYIISINPYGLINGIKCPAPDSGCTYT
jgi:hypothetical protein